MRYRAGGMLVIVNVKSWNLSEELTSACHLSLHDSRLASKNCTWSHFASVESSEVTSEAISSAVCNMCFCIAQISEVIPVSGKHCLSSCKNRIPNCKRGSPFSHGSLTSQANSDQYMFSQKSSNAFACRRFDRWWR